MAASVLSTVHRGVAFEQRSLQILQSQLSMSLHKVGGKSDGGVDLQGWWWLPPPSASSHPTAKDTEPLITWTGSDGVERRRLRVLGQCKAEKKKMGPNYVRELEGVLGRHNSQSGRQPAVGLLISQSAFTRSTVLRAFSSPIPLFLLHLPPDHEMAVAAMEGEEQESIEGLGSAVWNPALGSAQGLLAGEIEARWEWSLRGGSGRPGLWWKGERLKGWVPPKVILDEDLPQNTDS